MKKNINIVVLIFIFALILRICFLLLVNDPFVYTLLPDSDGRYYHEWASGIAGGNFIGDKIFFGMPLYPYLLGMMYKLLGPVPVFANLLQFLMGSLNAVLIYLIVRKIFNHSVALVSSLIFASYVMIIFYEVLIMPVTLILLLNSILILYLLRCKENPSWGRMCLLGIIFGLTALAEAGILLFLILFIIWMFFSFKQKNKEKLVYILIILFSVFAVLSLVTVRNYLVGKDFVFITSHSGINFFLGNNPQAQGIGAIPSYLRSTQKGVMEDARIYAEKQSNKELKPSEVSSFWTKRALDFIKNKPSDYLKLQTMKMKIFWGSYEPVDTTEFAFLYNKKFIFNIIIYSFGVIVSLGLVGVVVSLLIKKSQNITLLLLFVLSQFLSSITFFVTARNRLVIVPFLIVFSAYFLCWVFEQIKDRKIKPLIPALFLFAVLFLMFNFRSYRNGAFSQYKYLDFERSYNLGVLYAMEESYDKAVGQYGKALELRPEDHKSYFGLANVYNSKGDIKKAIELYMKAIKINPNYIDAYFNLGYLYQQAGDLKKAKKFYKIVIDLDTLSLDAYFNLGDIYRSQGKCDKAINYYQKVLSNKPEYYNQVYPELKKCLQ